MICIDFVAGAHGNYLEFVGNKIAGLVSGSPFNSLGAAHFKQDSKDNLFVARHYSTEQLPLKSKKVISIRIKIDDLLPLQQVSLLRAGDLDIDNDQLEIDTYHKLSHPQYDIMLEQLLRGFFENQIKTSYDAVKDPSWPDVCTLSDFAKLPQWIQDECRDVHNLTLLELNEQHPNCPRNILREFFKIGFANPAQQGFIVNQRLMQYPSDVDVFEFPFSCFYNTEEFLKQIRLVAQWAELPYNCENDIVDLHREFLKNQPYKDSKSKCDQLIEQIKINRNTELPKLDLLEQAYINSRLEQDLFE